MRKPKSKPEIFRKKRSDTVRLNLGPRDDTDKVFDAVYVDIFPDNSLDLCVKGHMNPDCALESVDIDIDFDAGTYCALETDFARESLADGTVSGAARGAGGVSLERAARDTGRDKENDQVAEPEAQRKSKGINLRAYTKDPAHIVLCESCNYLGWTYDGAEAAFDRREYNTFAANPSSLGTNWYVSGEGWKEGIKGDPRNVRSDFSAEFYNYDFMGLNLRTDVAHEISLTGKNNGAYEYSAHMKVDGLFQWLLYFSFDVWEQTSDKVPGKQVNFLIRFLREIKWKFRSLWHRIRNKVESFILEYWRDE
jgi:hypothetical protein